MKSNVFKKDLNAKKDNSSAKKYGNIPDAVNIYESSNRIRGNIRDTYQSKNILKIISTVNNTERNSILLKLQKTHGNRYIQRLTSKNETKPKKSQLKEVYGQKTKQNPYFTSNKITANSSTDNHPFKPALNLIQRQKNPSDTGKTLTEGISVVKEQLEDQPGYKEWKERQIDILKKKLWDSQPNEFKSGIITFLLFNGGMLGTTLSLSPEFRTKTIEALNDKNILAPLSLIPYHEYFLLSSFKYKLPEAKNAPLTFDTEFELGPYFDLMRKKWPSILKTDLSIGVSSAYSPKGFSVTGGSFKLKLGGGIINLSAFINQPLPPTPSLISGSNPGESPMWLMRTLPGQFEDQLPKGSGVFLTIDLMRLPQLGKTERKTR